MEATLNASTYVVVVDNGEVNDFARSWPAHELDLDAEYGFEFSASNGDLVDLWKVKDGSQAMTDDDDGPALAAMSEDAGIHGARELGLADVLAIRLPSPSA